MVAPDMEYIHKELRRRGVGCRFMLVNQTIECLRRMRLTGMAEAFLAQNQDAGYRALSLEERFGLLVDQESTYREDRRLKRLLKGARLKTQACVEDIDYGHSRGLDRSVMAGLSTCPGSSWTWASPPGTGLTRPS
jgi:hypothetical protein